MTDVVAEMPALVVRVDVVPGAVVEAGDTLIVVESMKLEIAITSPVSGKVNAVVVEVGEQVAEGSLLLRITP